MLVMNPDGFVSRVTRGILTLERPRKVHNIIYCHPSAMKQRVRRKMVEVPDIEDLRTTKGNVINVDFGFRMRVRRIMSSRSPTFNAGISRRVDDSGLLAGWLTRDITSGSFGN